jgi:hypothetical protein
MYHVSYKKIPWSESASELYQSNERRLIGEIAANFFADRGCHVVSVTDPYCRILDFLDLSRYFFIQVAPQLYSRSWVDPVPVPLLLRKSDSAGNRNRDLRICSQELWPLDHGGGQVALLRQWINAISPLSNQSYRPVFLTCALYSIGNFGKLLEC